MRWDLLNSIVLCAGCHFWWHGNPTEATEWFSKKFYWRVYYLNRQRKLPVETVRTSELAEWLEERKLKLKELQDG